MPRRVREKGPWFWRASIAAMLAGVFGVFAVAAVTAPPATDGETGCRVDGKDPAHTIVLIDQSDPFAPNDTQWVRALIEAEARALPQFGRLSLMRPDSASPWQPEVLHSACSPGSPEQANPLTANPAMVEDAWRIDFRAPIFAAAEAALEDTRQPSSPLAEALFAIADRPDFQTAPKGLRLVLVSDLMQHSEPFSFYRSGADYAAFDETPLAAQLPDLDGVEVVARIVPRQRYDLPLGEVKAFWRTWFEAAGAEYGSVN